MNKSSEQRPNPSWRDTNPGNRVSLFTVASILFSFIFIGYGVMNLVIGKADILIAALALITAIYGLYGLAVVVYAYQKGGRTPVFAIQVGAVSFLFAYVVIVSMNPIVVSGLGNGLIVAIGIWCNWIAVIKIVKKSPTSTTRKGT